MAASPANNPFLQQLQLLQASLPASPPPGYADRLIAQMVLCGFLTLCCILYLIIFTHEHKKAGKSIAIFRLKRERHGSLITFNTLCLYVLLVGLGGAVLEVFTVRKYLAYFHGQSQKYLPTLVICCWISPLFSTWIFVFSTSTAALSVNNSNGLSGGSLAAVIFYNTFLFAIPTAYLGSSLPLGYVLNKKTNTALDLVEELVTLLTQGAAALTDGHDLDFNLLVSLSQKATELKALQHDVTRLTNATLAIAMGVVVFCGSMATASYSFVLLLRKQSRFNTHSVFVKQELYSINPGGAPSGSFKRTPAIQLMSKPSEEAKTLTILYWNLTLALPALLLEAIFFIVAGSLVLTVLQNDRSWKFYEFYLDAFTWSHGSVQCCIVLFFLVNFFLRPGRFGRSTSSPKNSGRINISRPLSQGSSGHRSNPSDFQVSMVPMNKSAYGASYPSKGNDELEYSPSLPFGGPNQVKYEM